MAPQAFVQLNVRLPQPLYERLMARAAAKDQSLVETVRQALETALAVPA